MCVFNMVKWSEDTARLCLNLTQNDVIYHKETIWDLEATKIVPNCVSDVIWCNLWEAFRSFNRSALIIAMKNKLPGFIT